MNIPTGKIENNEFYIEVAFKRANESAKLTRLKVGGSRIQKSQMIEAAKLDSVNDVLSNFLEKIQAAFPNYRELTVFYQELIKCYFDVGDFRKSLAAMIWAKEKIAEFCKFYKHKILKCTQLPKINQFRTQFYGRVSSTMKQINKNLQLLEEARKILNDFPVVKMMKTVCIAGFPNVGKTTLLSKLTKSKPEIASYSFTTKRLNMGYSDDIQFIDTPGTLNRLEKMNAIERQALMAMKYVADKIIYVFDLTEIYPIEDQIKLLDVVKEFRKPVIIYLSKTDILDDYMEFAKKYNAVTDIEELKRKI